jgi:iron complex outermembrane receptor protein
VALLCDKKEVVVFKDVKPLALGALSTVPAIALGQEPAPEPAGFYVEEIVVTAQKRETTVQRVPFSIVALTPAQVRNSGTTNLAELARNVAGLSITDLGPGQSQVAIRGISAGQVVRDQPGLKEQVAVYLDESPISLALFTPDLDLIDLDRVEVLRGPQGTLYGAGSLSGTVRYITAQPQLGQFSGSTELSLNEGTDSDFGGNLKGAVNIPVGDSVAMRVAGYYNKLSGFIDATQPGGVVSEDVNEGDKSGGRLALLWKPTEQLSITPRVLFQKLETDGFPRVDVYNILGNPFTTTSLPVNLGDRGQFTQVGEGLEDDFALGDFKVDYDFPSVRLTSVTSFTDRDVVVVRDVTQISASVLSQLGVPDAIAAGMSSTLNDATDLQSVSQEIRFSSLNSESRFQWVFGGFYQDLDRDYGQMFSTPGLDALIGVPSQAVGTPAPDLPFFSNITYDLKQFAVFGEGTYNFSDTWNVTAGARYYNYEEDRLLTFAGAFSQAGSPGVTPAQLANVPGSTDSDGVSPRLILGFNPSDDMRFTAQVSRGFRLGGINDPLNLPVCSPATNDAATFGALNNPNFDDETVLNYELGAKTRWADGRVTFNAAVFYSDIKDLQATLDALSCSSRVVFNVPDASSRGVELELFARPSERWDFGISATFLDAQLDSTVTDATGMPVQGLQDGNQLPTSPELQAAASVTYSYPFSSTAMGYVNFTVQHVGERFTQLGDQAAGFGTIALIPFGGSTISTFTFNPELPSYEIGNLRLGAAVNTWEFAAFVNNIADEQARLSLDRERGGLARIGFLTNQPRTYGFSVRTSF